MIEKFQKQLQIGGWLVVAVLALSAVWLGQSIDQLSRTGNVGDVITVSGTGTVSATPDIAMADLAISVEGSTAASAQTEANRRSKMAVDYLKGVGIKETDIKTSGYSIYPQYDYTDGRTRIRGYQVTQSLAVKIRDMDKANTVLDGVVDAGVNQVNNFRFEIDEPDRLKDEARAKAIADANAKAHGLKSQLGIRLGKIVSFSESGDALPPIIYGRGGAMDVKVSSAPAPELPAGENEITVNVTITYQLR
ncbi:MAG: SIMPL domain-containing protein [Candidatus Yanofskybacteria bacterium]|nr:SIMPL domain-containing protein [Candidatus Yanofskybacteria bacterium]